MVTTSNCLKTFFQVALAFEDFQGHHIPVILIVNYEVVAVSHYVQNSRQVIFKCTITIPDIWDNGNLEISQEISHCNFDLHLHLCLLR